MLSTTKQCLESVKNGVIDREVAVGARSRAQGVWRGAAGASAARRPDVDVDDELADMDRAIEDAAQQIEVPAACVLCAYMLTTRLRTCGLGIEYNEDARGSRYNI